MLEVTKSFRPYESIEAISKDSVARTVLGSLLQGRNLFAMPSSSSSSSAGPLPPPPLAPAAAADEEKPVPTSGTSVDTRNIPAVNGSSASASVVADASTEVAAPAPANAPAAPAAIALIPASYELPQPQGSRPPSPSRSPPLTPKISKRYPAPLSSVSTGSTSLSHHTWDKSNIPTLEDFDTAFFPPSGPNTPTPFAGFTPFPTVAAGAASAQAAEEDFNFSLLADDEPASGEYSFEELIPMKRSTLLRICQKRGLTVKEPDAADIKLIFQILQSYLGSSSSSASTLDTDALFTFPALFKLDPLQKRLKDLCLRCGVTPKNAPGVHPVVHMLAIRQAAMVKRPHEEEMGFDYLLSMTDHEFTEYVTMLGVDRASLPARRCHAIFKLRCHFRIDSSANYTEEKLNEKGADGKFVYSGGALESILNSWGYRKGDSRIGNVLRIRQAIGLETSCKNVLRNTDEYDKGKPYNDGQFQTALSSVRQLRSHTRSGRRGEGGDASTVGSLDTHGVYEDEDQDGASERGWSAGAARPASTGGMPTSSTALVTLDRRASSAGDLVQRITGTEGAQQLMQQRRLHRAGRGGAKGINHLQWKLMGDKYDRLQSAASTSQPAAASAASVAAAFAISSSSAFQAQLPPAAAAAAAAPERKHSPGKSGKKLLAPHPPASVDGASDEEDEDGAMPEHQDEIVSACRMMRSILPKLKHFNNIAAKSKGLEEERDGYISLMQQLGGRMANSSSEDMQAAVREVNATNDLLDGANKRIRLMQEFGTLADGMFIPLVRDLTTSLNISKPTTPVNTPAPSPAAVGEGALICGACHKPLLTTSRPVFINECGDILCGVCNERTSGSAKCPCCNQEPTTRSGVRQ